MNFCAARLIRNAPRRCTPSTMSQSSSDILNSRLSLMIPALLIRTTGGPSSAATLPTAVATCSASLTSAPTATARPPAAVIASTVGAQALASRSRTPTAMPSEASRLAVAAPMPRAAPVTMATRDESVGICWFSLVVRCHPWLGGAALLTRGTTPAGLRPVAAQFAARQRTLVHLVGAVGEPQRPGRGPQVGERGVLADPGRTVRLDRLVDHPLGHRRSGDLDRLDLGVGALVPHRVHQPRGLEDKQPGLLDPDPRLGDPVLDHALLGERPPERGPARDPLAQQFERPLGSTDHPHAVVDPARAEPGLGDGEPAALLVGQVGGGHSHVGEADLGVPAVRRVVVAEQAHAAADADAGGVPGYQDHRLLPVPFGARVGLAHHDEDLA